MYQARSGLIQSEMKGAAKVEWQSLNVINLQNSIQESVKILISQTGKSCTGRLLYFHGQSTMKAGLATWV
jgi:hypothetical protein